MENKPDLDMNKYYNSKYCKWSKDTGIYTLNEIELNTKQFIVPLFIYFIPLDQVSDTLSCHIRILKYCITFLLKPKKLRTNAEMFYVH